MAQMTKENFDNAVAEIAEKKVNESIESAVEKLAASIGEQLKAMQTEKKDIHVGEDRATQDPKNGFKGLGEFCKAVYLRDKSNGRVVDDRLLVMEKAAGTSMNESSPEYLGSIVPTEFSTTLLKLAVENSNFMGRCTRVPMQTNSIELPFVNGFDRSSGYVHGGVAASWLDEEEARSETRIKSGSVTLKLNDLAALAYVSNNLMEDSPISIEPLLVTCFKDALVYALDKAVIRGTGAGQPMGVINANAKIEVSIETGQEADTLEYDNLLKMFARQYRKGQAVWVANPDVLPQLGNVYQVAGMGGVPAYTPGGSETQYGTLFGRPVIFSEHADTIGDAGDIMFVDFSQYLIGEKQGRSMDYQTSMHIKFDYNQNCFRFTMRVDGRPWWASALTTENSSVTLSPFITLAARA